MADKPKGPTDELSFSVNLESLEAALLPEVALSAVGIKERADLQRWIESYPEIVEPNLLLVTTEFNQWQIREKKVSDRLDVLFLDSNAALLVAELKRGEAPDTTELQALKYAAYCSQLTVPDITEEYSRYHKVSAAEAHDAIMEQAPALEDRELGPVRVRIVAGSFGPSVTHVVLWLHELGLDIGCIQVTARQFEDTHAILTSRQILPPPAAEDYLVRRRRREAEEEEREASTRRRNSVVVLTEAAELAPGDSVTLNLDAFTPDQRNAVEQKINQSPAFGAAEWTGLGIRKALKWPEDGEVYSCSGLVWKMLNDLGFNPGSLPGPDFWLLPNGQTLYEKSCEIEDGPLVGEEDGSAAEFPAPVATDDGNGSAPPSTIVAAEQEPDLP